MTKKKAAGAENYKKFREMCENVSGLAELDRALNGSCTEPSRAESFAEKRTIARMKAITRYQDQGVNPDATNEVINGYLAAELNTARSAQEQYYAQHLEDILEGLPAGNLEKAVLGILPQKLEDEKHDGVVKLHADFLGYAQMLREYKDGKDVMNRKEETNLRRRIARRTAAEAVESDKVKNNLESLTDKGKRETAKALTEWAYFNHVYMEAGGNREAIYAEGMTALKEKETAVYDALGKAGISKKDYAIANLRKMTEVVIASNNPEAIQAHIKQVYDLGKAA